MEPRWYQREAHDAVWHYLCREQGSPIVVLPTGSGKSLLLAMLARTTLSFGQRVLIVAHRQELLVQNAEKVKALMPDLDVGVYSAGLNARDTDHAVVCCGIQSAYKRAAEFGDRGLVLVDECHLVQSDGEGMYRTFLGELTECNPHIRLAGMTATPFRLGEGRMTGKGKLFSKIVYSAPMQRLINEGYLSPLVTPSLDVRIDTSKLHVKGGEFVAGEVESAFLAGDNVDAACREIVAQCRDRKSILLFTSGVNHAAQVARTIREITGEDCEAIVGDTLPIERAAMLRRFKSGELRWLSNCEVLTTGFDSPRIDALAVLRATMSPGLFAQMVGRGLRVSESKSNCMILDYGGNIDRHGPIDSPAFGMESQKFSGVGSKDGPVVKRCPACDADVYAGTKECECGFAFPTKDAFHEQRAAAEAAILAEQQKPKTWIVEEVACGVHVKKGAESRTLRMNYRCQPADGATGNLTSETISEWVCLEHDGYARTKAVAWWRARSNAPVPSKIEEAVKLINAGAVAPPARITTTMDGKFVRIVSAELDEKPETWREDEPDESDGFGFVDEFTKLDKVPF